MARSPASTSSRLEGSIIQRRVSSASSAAFGRIADFMARGAEWRDERGGGSLHGEVPVSFWGTPVLIGLPQAQGDEEPAAVARARRDFDDGGRADAFYPVEESRLSLRRAADPASHRLVQPRLHLLSSAPEEFEHLSHDALGMPVLRGVPDKGPTPGMSGRACMVMARRPYGVRRDSVRRHFA